MVLFLLVFLGCSYTDKEQHLFIKILVNSIVWKWLCSQFTSYNLSAAKGFGLKYEGICFLQADCTIVGVYA